MLSVLLLLIVSEGVDIVMFPETLKACDSSFILGSIRPSLFACFRPWSSFSVLFVGERMYVYFVYLFVVDFISVHLSRARAGVTSSNRLIIPDRICVF